MFLQAQHENFSVLQDMGSHTVFLTSLCFFHAFSMYPQIMKPPDRFIVLHLN